MRYSDSQLTRVCLQLELAPLVPSQPVQPGAELLLRRCSTPKLESPARTPDDGVVSSKAPATSLTDYAPPLSPVTSFGPGPSYSSIPLTVLRSSSPINFERPPPRESHALPKITVVSRDRSPAFLERLAKQDHDRLQQLQQQHQQQLQMQLNDVRAPYIQMAIPKPVTATSSIVLAPAPVETQVLKQVLGLRCGSDVQWKAFVLISCEQ